MAHGHGSWVRCVQIDSRKVLLIARNNTEVRRVGARGKSTTDVCVSVQCTLSPSQVPSWNIVCTMNSEEVNISLGSTLKLLCNTIRYKIVILINCKIREQSS